MSVSIKFMRSGSFHAGEFLCIDLDKISKLEINRLRNTCELLALTPENPQQNNPFVIARRDSEYMLKDILADLHQLKQGSNVIIYEITDTENTSGKKIIGNIGRSRHNARGSDQDFLFLLHHLLNFFVQLVRRELPR